MQSYFELWCSSRVEKFAPSLRLLPAPTSTLLTWKCDALRVPQSVFWSRRNLKSMTRRKLLRPRGKSKCEPLLTSRQPQAHTEQGLMTFTAKLHIHSFLSPTIPLILNEAGLGERSLHETSAPKVQRRRQQSRELLLRKTPQL